MSQGNSESIPVKSKDGNFTFYLTKVSVAGESSVDVAVVDETQPKSDTTPETLVLTASIKPFINLVWGGTIVMVLGFFFSLIHRVRKIKEESKVLDQVGTIGSRINGNGTHKRSAPPKIKQKH
jgi:hypothetical protein